MDYVRKYSVWAILIALFFGLAIGLLIGWVIWPVEWENATPNELAPNYKALYVTAVADAYAVTGNAEMVNQALSGWGGDQAACQLASMSGDPAESARLESVASIVNGGQGCAGYDPNAAATTPEEEGSSIPWPILILLLILVGLVLAILWVLSRRQNAPTSANELEPSVQELPASTSSAAYAQETAVQPAQPASSPQSGGSVPLARFETTYVRGNPVFDDSFDIENTNGEFLGECGVTVAEYISAGDPPSATAFNVWVFDKQDVATVTKVVMSDHAFYDEALNAKLALSGERVLAQDGETIVLETTSLIINAQISEMDYGVDTGFPPQSYFDRFTIEIRAWVRDDDYEQPATTGGSADELDF